MNAFPAPEAGRETYLINKQKTKQTKTVENVKVVQGSIKSFQQTLFLDVSQTYRYTFCFNFKRLSHCIKESTSD